MTSNYLLFIFYNVSITVDSFVTITTVFSELYFVFIEHHVIIGLTIFYYTLYSYNDFILCKDLFINNFKVTRNKF